jgi:hypothetical protein
MVRICISHIYILVVSLLPGLGEPLAHCIELGFLHVCVRCWGSQLILSICRVNNIQLVNNVSLCKITFCSILFVVSIEMC